MRSASSGRWRQLEEICFWNQQDRARLRRVRIGRITAGGSQRGFGKRFHRKKKVNHLFPAHLVDTMNVDRPGLYNVETFSRRALVKEIISFREVFQNNESGNRGNIRRRQTGEKLTARRVFSAIACLNFPASKAIDGRLTAHCADVPQKKCGIQPSAGAETR